MKQETFIEIPGFSNYRISPETKEIQSSHKKWKPIKLHSNGLYRMLSDKGKEYSGSPNRILYAAQHGINPAHLDSDMYVVEHKGELRLFDVKQMAAIITKKKQIRSVEALRKDYEESARFIQIVLKAYDTEDYSQVVSEIWKYEPRLRGIMYSRHIALTKDKQDEMWMRVFDVTVDAIRGRRAYIVNVWGYLVRVLRTIHANEIKTRKLILSYDSTPPPFTGTESRKRGFGRRRLLLN